MYNSNSRNLFNLPLTLCGFLFVFLTLQSCGTTSQTAATVTTTTETAIAEKEEKELEQESPFTADQYKASVKRAHDLLHTRLEVSFDWPKAHLLGKASLKLKPHFYASDELVLDAKGFDLHEVALVTPGERKALKYDYNDAKIRIYLDREYKRDESFEIYIDYTAKPNELPQGGSAAITQDKGLYFINPDGSDPNKPTQLWTQGETEASSCWFPTIDKPNERTTQDIYITVDEKYTTLSNGDLISVQDNQDGTRTDNWRMDLPHAPYLFMMAVGDFAVEHDSWKGIPVDYYVAPEYGPYSKQIFGNTPEMLEFFSNKLGVRYPWPKYAQIVVEDFVSGAMENTTASIFYDALHMTDRELIDGDQDDIIAHELIHHWFGDLVTCESWSNLPLNESFATYGEYLWREYKKGRESADYHLQGDLRVYLMSSRQSGYQDLIRFDYEDKEDMFDGHSYQKGGRVLHMLRKYVGDDAFFASLKLYLERNQYTDVEIHELRLAFEDVTGEDLNWFFSQWFLGSGHPDIEIDYDISEDGKTTKVTLKQTQDREETPVYILPIDVDIYMNGEVSRERIVLDSREETFTFETDTRPDWINVDAEKMLLCVKKDNKPDEWWKYQLKNGPLFLDRYEAVEHFDKAQAKDPAARDQLEMALRDKFWVVQRKAISSLEVNDANASAIANNLLDIARKGEKSGSRVTAIKKLSNIATVNHDEFFTSLLDDRSYAVSSAALAELSKINLDKAYAHAQEIKGENSFTVIEAVMEVFAEKGSAADNAYFVDKLNTIGGFEKYFVITTYGEYIKGVESDQANVDGSKALYDIAMNSNTWWIGATATGVIRGMKDKYADKREELSAAGDINGTRVKQVEEILASLEQMLEDIDTK